MIEVLHCPLCGETQTDGEPIEVYQWHWPPYAGWDPKPTPSKPELLVSKVHKCATCENYWTHGDGTKIPDAITSLIHRSRPPAYHATHHTTDCIVRPSGENHHGARGQCPCLCHPEARIP